MGLPEPSDTSTAIVTGASSGIGVEFARELARRGQNVTLVARREDRLRTLADELAKEHSVTADVVKADLATEEGRRGMIDAVAANGKTVEILVNNAGYGSAGFFQRLDAESETRMVRLNCEAVVALAGEYLPGMIERGRGGVLNVASVAGFQPVPRQATYAATKAFVKSFTDALHTDLHGTGVTATALCPGLVPTEFSEAAGIDGGEWSSAPGFMHSSPEQNAKAGIKALEKGKRYVVPTLVNKISATSGQFTPRPVLLGVMRRFYPVGK
jgi:short-subunit dehydrogenase